MRRRFLPVIIAALTPIVVLGVLVSFTGLSLVEWQPPVIWTTQFGPPAEYSSNGLPVRYENSVTVLATASSGLYASGFVGYLYPYGSLDRSLTYMFVNRYDLTGHILWTQKFSYPASSEIKGIAAGSDGVYVVSTENLTGFVRKYDLNGTELWTTKYLNAGPCPRVQGGPYVTNDFALFSAATVTAPLNGPYPPSLHVPIDVTSLGNFSGVVSLNATITPVVTNGPSADFSSGPADVSVSRGSEVGVILFVDVPSSAPPNTYAIIVTGSNGSVSHSISMTLVVTSREATVQSSIKALSDITARLSVSRGTAGVFAALQCPLGGSNQNNVLAEYDSNGNLLWTSSLGNSTQGSLNVYSDISRLYVAGYLASAFLRSYGLNGSLYWAQNLNCTCVPSSVSADASGVYMAGYSYQGPYSTGFLTKYDLNGNQVWERELNPPDLTTVANLQMSVDSSGIYLAMTTPNSGFLMRYDTNGGQDWSFRIPIVLNSVSVAQGGVYVGGHYSFTDMSGSGFWSGFITEFGSSSSLILFGLNPPYSFILVAAVGGVVILSVLWLRRQIRKRASQLKSEAPYGPARPAEDESVWRMGRSS